jgi:hypothetical protein
VQSKVGETVVIAHQNANLRTLDVDSILCLEDRRVIGRVSIGARKLAQLT